MEHFKNISETFFREIRSIEIYKAEDIPYIDNFNGVFPDPRKALYIFDINPENYARRLSTKTQNSNYFADIDLSFPLLDMTPENIEKCYEYFNKKEFAIVLISNTEKLMGGNDREKLKVEFIDNKKDDNSGNDECTIAISGDTIIMPKLLSL